MKKRAFTLSELMVTMAIIGVVAALTAPAMTNLFPDKNKAKVLRYNALLESAISAALEDETIYHPHTDYKTVGTELVTFLAKDDGTECEALACLETDFADYISSNVIDKNKDGSSWQISESNGIYTIQVQTDSKESKVFSNGTTKNINTFIFKVNQFGNIYPGDALTDAYLTNSLKTNDKKADINLAKRFLTERSY